MKRSDLARPRKRRPVLGLHYEPDAFGQFSETIARNLGSARFLIVQTIAVVIWVSLNVAFLALQWDPYPFILLNLMFSVQAAYAAPLILLAHNRQESRDREQAQVDRNVANRTQNDAEFLAREIASVQLALANVVTADELHEQIDRISEQIEKLNLGDKKS